MAAAARHGDWCDRRLGVGGSVMTVPLMRRRGASMTAATAAANPLSLPMAVVGSATYALLAWNDAPLGAWHAGCIDLRACLVLVVGSWLGIRLASRWIGKIPDRLMPGPTSCCFASFYW